MGSVAEKSRSDPYSRIPAVQIARLRRLGRWGQHAHAADELERLAAQARRERQAPTQTMMPHTPVPTDIPK